MKARRSSESRGTAELTRGDFGARVGWTSTGSWTEKPEAIHRETTNAVLASVSHRRRGAGPQAVASLLKASGVTAAFPDLEEWLQFQAPGFWPLVTASTSAEETIKRAVHPEGGRTVKVNVKDTTLLSQQVNQVCDRRGVTDRTVRMRMFYLAGEAMEKGGTIEECMNVVGRWLDDIQGVQTAPLE